METESTPAHTIHNEALPELLGLQKLIGISSHGTEAASIAVGQVDD